MRLSFLLAALLLPLAAQAQDPSCARSMGDRTLVVNIRAGHQYRINMDSVPLAKIPSALAPFLGKIKEPVVYIIPEPVATYKEVQDLSDRLFATFPGLHIGILQPPASGSDPFKCTPATPSSPNSDILPRIPHSPAVKTQN